MNREFPTQVTQVFRRIRSLIYTRRSVFITLFIGILVALPAISEAVVPAIVATVGGAAKDMLFSYAKLIGTIGAILTLLALFSFFAGVLFDLALSWTVLETGSLLSSDGNLMPAIKGLWMIFRDIANVLIIGIFVFIAISTILGITKDGYRKMLVQLLSVALLINFSFFFTQVVFDISNWGAVQVYNSIATDDLAPRFTLHSNGTGEEGFSLSEKFMEGLQIQGWMSMVGSLVANSVTQPVQNIFFVIVTGILLFGIIVLLMRMAIMLISRWLIMVFLMATSSFAFVAMLIPKLHKYWEQWSNALIYNAIVAPALLLMLYVVTVLAQAILQSFPNTLGRTLLDPEAWKVWVMQPAYWNEIAVSVTGSALILMLLWAAVRISTMLATQASTSAGGVGKFLNSGLGWMEGLVTGGAAGVMFGRNGVAGLGQRTLGRGAASMADRLGKWGAGDNFALRQASRLASGIGLDESLSKIGKKTFDPRNASALKNILGDKSSLKVDMGSPIKKGFAALKKEDEEAQAKINKTKEKNIIEEAEGQAILANTLKNQASQIDKQIENQENSMANMRSEMSQAQGNKDTAGVNMDKAQKEVERLITQRNTAQEKLNMSGTVSEQAINSQMGEANMEIDRLQKQLQSPRSPEDYALDKGRLERLQERRAKLAELLQAHQQLNSAEGTLTNSRQAFQTASDTYDSTKTRLDDSIAQAQVTYDALQAKKNDVVMRLNEVNAQINTALNQIPGVEKLRMSLQEETEFATLLQKMEQDASAVSKEDAKKFRELEERRNKYASEIKKMLDRASKTKSQREEDDKEKEDRDAYKKFFKRDEKSNADEEKKDHS